MYETQLMNEKQMNEFTSFIDEKIGVDYEVNETDDDEYYILVLDLEEDEEYDALSDYENAMNPPTYSVMKFQSK